MHTRESWIRAAIQVLTNSGIDSVRVDTLAKQLSITRGSFYHHFKSRDDLLQGLLEYWRQRATEDVIHRIQISSDDPAEQIINLVTLPLRGKRSAEAASIEISIRTWARRDDTARTAVTEVDKYRLAFIAKIFIQLGHPRQHAEDLADLIYAYLVAMSLRYFDEDYDARRKTTLRLITFLMEKAY
jgi:AcrR family transcriptional regulator